ncbi:uncharacterized protein LOC132088217 [Daphnia carinata]|uniref:uncharacterized protein LOC132088217 n=1 Tax=Daphnia carinata TaxID=120202 RepID=UPI002868D5D8|nr:uncharacterized protein LOC132088217 [Daphnia carinata]
MRLLDNQTCVTPLKSIVALIVLAFIHPICAAALNRDSEDQSTYEPSMYYKMYASHYEVTTYEYTYPRIRADVISYSSYEADSPVYIATPRRLHTKKDIGKAHANNHGSVPTHYQGARELL